MERQRHGQRQIQEENVNCGQIGREGQITTRKGGNDTDRKKFRENKYLGASIFKDDEDAFVIDEGSCSGNREFREIQIYSWASTTS